MTAAFLSSGSDYDAMSGTNGGEPEEESEKIEWLDRIINFLATYLP